MNYLITALFLKNGNNFIFFPGKIKRNVKTYCPKEKNAQLTRTRTRIATLRTAIGTTERKHFKLLALVREYVAQRPEVSIRIVKKWINAT